MRSVFIATNDGNGISEVVAKLVDEDDQQKVIAVIMVVLL